MTLADALATALQKHRERDFCLAELTYLQILREDPNHFAALEGLGALLHQTGRHDAAAEHLGRAAQIQPHSADALNRLAIVLLESGRHIEAAAAYQAALAIAPDNARAWNNLGSAHAALRKMPEAEACFRRAVELNPNYFHALINLASALTDRGGYDEALTPCRKALAIRPDDPANCFLLAALTGENPPLTAPHSYVAPIFDSCANTFDALLADLRYSGPALLRGAVDDVPDSKLLDIMDIGCGTGLCGLAFHDLARTLTGVDLSEPMLQRAQARGIYDRLILGDLREALLAASEAYDLILSADVFIYVGDLTPVFPAARAALRHGGRFAVVVEVHEGEGFVLRKSRRYAHSAAYLRKLAASSGFAEVAMRKGALRVEHGHDIDGAVHVFRANS